MPVSDQGITQDRYLLIPRTAIFLRRGDSYLLMQGAASKKRWAGKYNCLGGHVERGEDINSAARRELWEEANLEADLWLCGTVVIDTGPAGVCLYVFTGESRGGEPQPSKEGAPGWVEYERVSELPVVEDLPVLLAQIHKMRRGDAPFSARSFYDDTERLRVLFSD
jgi:8-oxo-dGTP diphosphatase